jgi:DNA-binding Lrp family transcriptional regulator
MTDPTDPGDSKPASSHSRSWLEPRLDEIDRKILKRLQIGAHESIASIAEYIHLSRTGTDARIQKLELSGVILRYMAELDESHFTPWCVYDIDVLLTARGRRDRSDVDAALIRVPEILEAKDTIGEFDLRLEVALRSPADWRGLIFKFDPYSDLVERAQPPLPIGATRKRRAPHPFLLSPRD